MTKNNLKQDPEIVAIGEVHAALMGLESEAQARILKFVADKLKLSITFAPVESPASTAVAEVVHSSGVIENVGEKDDVDEELEGISPGGRKWIARNGFKPVQLARIFSIGGDEIDLIANSVPGNSKAKRMHSVILLKGMASYLSSGAARLTDQEIRETCLHYDALDAGNFSTQIKGLASEVTGSKETGYTLSARGQTNATEMIKEMLVSV